MSVHLRWAIVLTVLAILWPQAVQARDIRQGDQCEVPADQTIVGDLFVLCRTLEINGVVQGNLLGAATTARINGEIQGSVYLIAGQLEMLGIVGETLHFAGPAMRVGENAQFRDAGSDILSASLSTTIEPEARIPDNVVGIGYQLVLNGQVDGEVSFWGSSLLVGGTVARNVVANVGDSESAGVAELQALLTLLPVNVTLERPGLRVTSDGRINGQLLYTAPSEGVIEGTLSEPAQFTQVVVQPDLGQITAITEPEDAGRSLGIYFGQVIREFFALLIIGGLLLLLTPNTVQPPLRMLSVRPLASLGLGLLTFIISFPLFAILLLFSVLIVLILALLQLGDITIGSAVLLGVVNLGIGTIFYFLAIFVSRAIVAYGLGRLLVRAFRAGWSGRTNSYIQLIVGSAILALAFSLPAIGWLISGIAAFLGLGAVLAQLQFQFESRRRTAVVRPVTVLPGYSTVPHQIPPPMLDSGTSMPGMDNLPAGFRWWDE